MKNQTRSFQKFFIFLFGIFLTMPGFHCANAAGYVPVPSTRTQNFLLVVELDHSFATKGQITSNIGWADMHQAAANIFWYEYDLANGSYEINVAVSNNNGLFQYLVTYWGIRAAKMTINDVVIDDSFIKESADLLMGAVSFDLLNGAVSAAAGTTRVIDSRVPAELAFHQGYVRYKTPAMVPGGGFTAVLPWMQALHLNPDAQPSVVEIDYLRLISVAPNGTETIIVEDLYSGNLPSTHAYAHGGAYLRSPFFYDEANHHWEMPVTETGGLLSMTTSKDSDKVYHWWGSYRALAPGGADHFIARARVRITGPAMVQFGIDFWRDLNVGYGGLNVNNTEAGVSDCFFTDENGPGTDGQWMILEFSTQNLIAPEAM